MSATAQYTIDGTYVLKAGYAATTKSTVAKDAGQDDASTALTGRLGYLLPSTYLYADIRSYDYKGHTTLR